MSLPRAVIEEVKAYFASWHNGIGNSTPHHQPGAVAAHDILSTSHGDTDAGDTPVEGDAMVYRSAQWVAEPPANPVTAHEAAADPHTGYLKESEAAAAVRTLVLSAAGGAPTTTAGCAEQAKVELGTNDVDLWVLDHDATTPESSFWGVVMPDNWNAGTLVAKFYWTAASGSGGVVWGIKARCHRDDDAMDAAYGTEVETADTLLAANDMHITPASSAVTVGGTPAAGAFVQIKVTRKTAHASDTLGVDARLIAVKIEYTTNAYSD